MSAGEKAFVEALAARQGITAPALFMRAVVTGGADAAARYEQLREELAAARRVLVGLAGNVNQLARQANMHAAGDVAPVTVAQMRAAAAAVERVVARIDGITSRVAPVGLDADEQAHVGDDLVDVEDDVDYEGGREHDVAAGGGGR